MKKKYQEFIGTRKRTKGQKLFEVFNIIIIVVLLLCCLVPILNLPAYSFSSSNTIISNRVGVFPVGFTTEAYAYVLRNAELWTSAKVTLLRVALGVPFNLLTETQ